MTWTVINELFMVTKTLTANSEKEFLSAAFLGFLTWPLIYGTEVVAKKWQKGKTFDWFRSNAGVFDPRKPVFKFRVIAEKSECSISESEAD